MLKRGYNGGAWDGKVIDSAEAASDPNLSTAIGFAEASDVLHLAGTNTATWMGRTVDATAILFRYTKYGDANLDGLVDFNDLARLAQNYNAPSGKQWADGDFNFDNAVDFNDLAKLAQNYNTALPASLPPSFDGDFQGDLAAALANVPEPASLALLGFAACRLSGRHRRRRRGPT
jgi:hypothetical protein